MSKRKEREEEEEAYSEWFVAIFKNSEYGDCGVYATERSNLTEEQVEGLLSGENSKVRAEENLEDLGIPVWGEEGSMWRCLAWDEDDKELHEFTDFKHRRLCQLFYVYSE